VRARAKLAHVHHEGVDPGGAVHGPILDGTLWFQCRSETEISGSLPSTRHIPSGCLAYALRIGDLRHTAVLMVSHLGHVEAGPTKGIHTDPLFDSGKALNLGTSCP
jgi:hypothetical protein